MLNAGSTMLIFDSIANASFNSSMLYLALYCIWGSSKLLMSNSMSHGEASSSKVIRTCPHG
jgi:hypothetical protein